MLAVYGTGLYPILAHAPDPRRATAFLVASLGLLAAPRAAAWTPARYAVFATAVVTGGAIGGSIGGPPQAPDLLRALFGSRDGVLFWAPLLWACLPGLVILLRKEGGRAAPLVAVSLAPFAAAPFLAAGGSSERYDYALPALLVGLAAALDALCSLVQRQPAWLLAVLGTALGASNLLFMEQYRQSPRRDQTVSFAEVSEVNARLVSSAVGSPLAWPANWLWSARHGLPVERWDLLSGRRLDPFAADAVGVDVGDQDQDAAFLFDGWGVRHFCADAVCRQVAGRAEVVLPVEDAGPLCLSVRAAGAGVLRVHLNGAPVGSTTLGPELAWSTLPATPWRKGPNRVVFETPAGGHALLDQLRLSTRGR